MATHSIANVALQVNQTTTATSSGKSVPANNEAVVVEQQSVAVAQAQEIELPRETMDNIVSHLKEYVQQLQRDMDFQVDDVTGRVVITVIDSQSKEVIRRIPSEEALAISRHLAELLAEEPKGFLIELKA